MGAHITLQLQLPTALLVAGPTLTL